MQLQEAFAKGLLKPGLNIEVKPTKQKINNIVRMQQKLAEIQQTQLPWLERLDMINTLAPVAPELAVQFERHEQKRASQFAGNSKLKAFPAEADPVLNDFRREMLFYRQAQSAVAEGIRKLHALNVPTKRPDDYFAEMAKSDEHMQKVRANLMAKQEGQAKSERIKQIREQRKMGKQVQRQARVQRVDEKREMMDNLKKFRKGKLKNLDFLEDGDGAGGKSGGSSQAARNDAKKASKDKRKAKDSRFGFGGKKRGMKRNTKTSSMEGGDFKGKKGKGAGPKGRSGAAPRPGKSARTKTKSQGQRKRT